MRYITFKSCTPVYNCVNGSAPMYLQEICNSVSADVHRPPLRSIDRGDLVVPRANTDRFGRRGFSVSGPNRWNKLPPDIQKVSDKPEQFARALKTFLFPNSTDKHFWGQHQKEGYSNDLNINILLEIERFWLLIKSVFRTVLKLLLIATFEL